MVTTTAVSDVVSGVLRAPRRHVSGLTHRAERPAVSAVPDAVRRDPALTVGQRTALVELYESFRTAPPARTAEAEVDHSAAARAHVC